MISLLNSSDDSLRLQGIRHFIETSGIPIDVNQCGNADLCIQYGGDQRGDFSICMHENAARDQRYGTIDAFETKVPVFSVPENTGKGDAVLGFCDYDGDPFPCISRSGNRILFGFDLFKEVGYILSGGLEKIREDCNGVEKNRIAQVPLLDLYEYIFFRTILEGCRSLNLPLVRKAYWPEGKRFAVCLTHDVDELKKTYQWITRPLRYLKSGDLHGVRNQVAALSQKVRGTEPYWTFEEIIRLNQKHSVTSTFFFLKESAKAELFSPDSWHHAARCRDLGNPETISLLERLSREGNEIGLHGSYNSYDDPDLLLSEKEELEKISGRKIGGTRQHHLNLDIPRTWQYQQEAGLLYDTTLGFKDQPGFRFGTCFPFHPVAGGLSLELLEIPLAIMDITLHGRPDPWIECKKIIDVVEERRGVLTLLWHPPVFNELEYPGDAEIYDRFIASCLKKDAWVTGAGEVARWWMAREKTRLEYEVEQGLLTIALESYDPRQDIEVFLPGNLTVDLRSKNTEIVREENGCVRIRPHEQPGRREIVMGME